MYKPVYREFPIAAAPQRVACITVTPDSNFVIDVHPDNDRIVIASPCSGHGFKHSAAIGEVLAEQVIDGKGKIDINTFSMKKFMNLLQ
jgi:sarcosine oxidase